MNTAWCTYCGDQFDPIEGRPPSEDPDDQSNFCSDDHYDLHHALIDAEEAYRSAGYGSPVWP